MSIDKQGKGTGEGAVERNTSRPAENKPTGGSKSSGSSGSKGDTTNDKVKRVLEKK